MVLVSIALPSSVIQTKKVVLGGTTPLVKQQLSTLETVIEEWVEALNGKNLGTTCCYCSEKDLIGKDVVFTSISDKFRSLKQNGVNLRLKWLDYYLPNKKTALELIKRLTVLKFICSVKVDDVDISSFSGLCNKTTSKCPIESEPIKVKIIKITRKKN